MPFYKIGGIYIGGVQLNTDPDTYEPSNWKKRFSMHPVVGGGVVIQDFGFFARDNTIRLGGSRAQLIDEETRLALDTLDRIRGATHTFTDWLGNDFMVFITNFTAIPFKRGGGDGTDVISLFTYVMELRCTTITTLFGTAYAGS